MGVLPEQWYSTFGRTPRPVNNCGIAVLGVLPETQNSITGSTPSTSRGVVQITSQKSEKAILLNNLGDFLKMFHLSGRCYLWLLNQAMM